MCKRRQLRPCSSGNPPRPSAGRHQEEYECDPARAAHTRGYVALEAGEGFTDLIHVIGHVGQSVTAPDEAELRAFALHRRAASRVRT